MTTLACVIVASLAAIYAVRAWQVVRMAQLTDASVRAEWKDYRAEVNGALDVALKRVNDHESRVDVLEKAKRTEAVGRIGRTG